MYQNFATSSMHVKAEQTNSLIQSSVVCIWLAFTLLQNGRRRGSLGNALPKHLCDWCLIAEGVGWKLSKDVVSKFLRAASRGRRIFCWTGTSQKWHKLFSAGRGNCRFPLELLSPGTCIRFATAVWKKMFPCCQSFAHQASNWKKLYNAQVGTCRKRNKLFSQGRANQHFSLERKVRGRNLEIPQHAEKSYVTLWVSLISYP